MQDCDDLLLAKELVERVHMKIIVSRVSAV